ncbi:hypothetical protein E4U53_002508, partial [Claviceps sorghi]
EELCLGWDCWLIEKDCCEDCEAEGILEISAQGPLGEESDERVRTRRKPGRGTGMTDDAVSGPSDLFTHRRNQLAAGQGWLAQRSKGVAREHVHAQNACNNDVMSPEHPIRNVPGMPAKDRPCLLSNRTVEMLTSGCEPKLWRNEGGVSGFKPFGCQGREGSKGRRYGTDANSEFQVH